MTSDLILRDVVEDDLPIFFEQQLDPEANYMAAFTAKGPTNREAFSAHWNRILVPLSVGSLSVPETLPIAAAGLQGNECIQRASPEA